MVGIVVLLLDRGERTFCLMRASSQDELAR
jgi:hypothetical protein